MWESPLVLVLLLIDWESGTRFFNQTLSTVNAKQKQTQITFNTQVNTALCHTFMVIIFLFKNECEGFIRFPNVRKHLKPRGFMHEAP